MTNHIIAPYMTIEIKNCDNVNILITVQTHVIVQFIKTVQCSTVLIHKSSLYIYILKCQKPHVAIV